MERFFLVGSPRSGTTMLQSLLASHSDIHSFPETHYLTAMFGNSRTRRWTGLVNVKKSRNQLSKIAALLQLNKYEDRIAKIRLPLANNWMKIYSEVLQSATKEANKKVWLEKTPIHLHYLPQIERFLGSVGVIHIIRDGVSTIASQVDVARNNPEEWGRKWSLEGATDRWLFDYSLHKKNLKRTNHHFVVFEDLVQDTEKTLRKIVEFMDLQYDEAMLSSRVSFNGIAENFEVWKENASRAISRPKSKVDIFEPEELRWLQDRISGYDISVFRGS